MLLLPSDGAVRSRTGCRSADGVCRALFFSARFPSGAISGLAALSGAKVVGASGSGETSVAGGACATEVSTGKILGASEPSVLGTLGTGTVSVLVGASSCAALRDFGADRRDFARGDLGWADSSAVARLGEGSKGGASGDLARRPPRGFAADDSGESVATTSSIGVATFLRELFFLGVSSCRAAGSFAAGLFTVESELVAGSAAATFFVRGVRPRLGLVSSVTVPSSILSPTMNHCCLLAITWLVISQPRDVGPSQSEWCLSLLALPRNGSCRNARRTAHRAINRRPLCLWPRIEHRHRVQDRPG